MEDVLDVYTRPHDPARPVVCLDEISKQWVAETRTPVPAAPGQPARIDDEYERHGTVNLFLTCEPLAGHRHVTVTERRTAVDFTKEVRDLLEARYPHAGKVVLVMDNLNTHKPAALYQAFEPALFHFHINHKMITTPQAKEVWRWDDERAVVSFWSRPRHA